MPIEPNVRRFFEEELNPVGFPHKSKIITYFSLGATGGFEGNFDMQGITITISTLSHINDIFAQMGCSKLAALSPSVTSPTLGTPLAMCPSNESACISSHQRATHGRESNDFRMYILSFLHRYASVGNELIPCLGFRMRGCRYWEVRFMVAPQVMLKGRQRQVDMAEIIIPYLGNKRNHVETIVNHLPHGWDPATNRYIEPFLGTGVVFQNICPLRAILSDSSPFVMNVHRFLKDDSVKFLERLSDLYAKNSKELYLACQRDILNQDPFTQAIMYAYLQRTSLYSFACPRTDLSGFRGCYKSTGKPLRVLVEVWQRMSRALNQGDVNLITGDFEKTMRLAEKGDFLFLDPPYVNTGTKVYNRFAKDDKERLYSAIRAAHDRGVYVMLFNHGDNLSSLNCEDFREKPVVKAGNHRSAFRNYNESMYVNYSLERQDSCR